jgi:DNA mismatch endonuclease Vsr
MQVRRIVYRLGYRFRLHFRKLPGTPDLAFPKRQKTLSVHGCFWHQHPACERAGVPKSNRGFWRVKLARIATRDAEVIAAIRKQGWRVLVIWECQIKDELRPAARLRRFLG